MNRQVCIAGAYYAGITGYQWALQAGCEPLKEGEENSGMERVFRAVVKIVVWSETVSHSWTGLRRAAQLRLLRLSCRK